MLGVSAIECRNCYGDFVGCVFNQKTAYERRISDWSSDVCSSDLRAVQGGVEPALGERDDEGHPERDRHCERVRLVPPEDRPGGGGGDRCEPRPGADTPGAQDLSAVTDSRRCPFWTSYRGDTASERSTDGSSDEHTSELQSLMRI